MPNYQDAKIYKIYVDGVEDVYIGSTTQKLCVRMAKHRRDYKLHKKTGKSYIYSYKMFDTYGLDNCKIMLLEYCPCNSREELHKKEGDYIKNNIKSVNKFIAGRNMKEWREDNKEVIAEKNKEYRENNKEVIAEKNKKYCEANREYRSARIACSNCGAEVNRSSLPRHMKSLKCQNYKP